MNYRASCRHLLRNGKASMLAAIEIVAQVDAGLMNYRAFLRQRSKTGFAA